MRKMTTSLIETCIAKFLFHQHLTPHTFTGNALAELLLCRRPRSLLDVVRHDLSTTVLQYQESQKELHDDHTRASRFDIGDSVFV